jgi:hypothetical protein
MSIKKNKNITSKGGSSFLTVKKSDNIEEKSNNINSQKNKSEEEKIEEFAEKVASFLDKIENIRLIFISFFERNYPLVVEKIKFLTSKGKLKFLKPLLPLFIIIQKINEKWFNTTVEYEEDNEEKDDNKKENTNEPRKPVTFLELAEKNIIFTDNRKRPLYTLEQLRDKSGYTASESVVNPIIMENIINAFREVAPKARSIPTPETGKYAGTPMDQVMENITEEDIMEFLEYVRNFPRGYVGKNYRITESFAGWAVSGTPED